MSYVSKVLQPGEKVRHVGELHWKVYLPGVGFLILGGIVLVWANKAEHMQTTLSWISAGLFVVAILALFQAWFKRWITEIAVTDRRIIYKQGFISRRTFEIALSKVESVDVDQSVLGRILNYGDIEIHGVGEGGQTLPDIEDPIALRNHVTAE